MNDTFIEYEMVLEVLNAGDQAFLKSVLDAEHFDYFIQGEAVAPYLFHSVAMRLMVKKDQAAAARELLKDFRQGVAYTGLKSEH